MRILFISQLFDPENSIKGLEFARQLHALGHEIEVVTTFPSYPSGKLYPGYRQRLKHVEIVDGIKIVRLPTFINYGNSALARLLSYGTFGLVATLYSLCYSNKSEVIYAYYPPVVVGFVAMIVSRWRNIPYVYDVQDLWPEALVATGNVKAESRIVRIIDKLCGIVYRKAGKIVVLSEGYRNALIDKQVVDAKIVRVFNWCDENRMNEQQSVDLDVLDRGFFNILYAGNFGPAQALEYVIEAANLVKNTGAKHIKFIFLGMGSEEQILKQKVISLGLDNVQFFARVPVDQVGNYLAIADVLLVHLADEPVFEITIPQKTQAYLYAGRPILMAVKGEAGDVIRDAGAGLVVEPCRPEQIARAALAMSRLSRMELNAMGELGQAYYRKRMSMGIGVQAVDDLLKSVGAPE